MSTPKTGAAFGGMMDMGKNRKNIELIIQTISSALNGGDIKSIITKSKTKFIIFGLFLGLLGAHNFYAGYKFKAIIQLLITVFLGWLLFPMIIVSIWALFEIFIIKKDSQGVYFS